MVCACDKLGVPQFRRAEVAFRSIVEYVTVMKLLATALDILQCETKVYIITYGVPCVNLLHSYASIQICKTDSALLSVRMLTVDCAHYMTLTEPDVYLT